MKKLIIQFAFGAICGIVILSSFAGQETNQQKNQPANLAAPEPVSSIVPSVPLVNYDYFEQLVAAVKEVRNAHLVPLVRFLKEGNNPNKVILDTRSKAMYDLKHVKGAIHLNFSDFTAATLGSIFAPYSGKQTEIYIYCNNNFYDSQVVKINFQDEAFMSKAIVPIIFPEQKSEIDMGRVKSLALNIPTFINLYGYGFQNVYELNEFVDVNDPRIKFEGTFND
jgi:hypothetical protein